jgi:hypothetical protein
VPSLGTLRAPPRNAARPRSNAAPPRSNAALRLSNATPPRSNAACPDWERCAARLGTLSDRRATLPPRGAPLRDRRATLHALRITAARPRSTAAPSVQQRCSMPRLARAVRRCARMLRSVTPRRVPALPLTSRLNRPPDGQRLRDADAFSPNRGRRSVVDRQLRARSHEHQHDLHDARRQAPVPIRGRRRVRHPTRSRQTRQRPSNFPPGRPAKNPPLRQNDPGDRSAKV